ncbi:MAG TPA: pitrilysin family protein [Gemmatimonadaceae bacterium]|nr:pitrilysin family protein [Gemmatimonadaceae bacterium]
MKWLPTAMLLVLAAPAVAQAPLAPRNNSPATSPVAPKPATAMATKSAKMSAAARTAVGAPGYRTFTMYNGMKVTLIHAGVDKKAVVDLELNTGQIDEPAFAPGLAALTAGLLLEGTIARTSAQILSEAASFGGAINTSVGPVSTSLSGEVGTEHIARFISLLSDVVRHPRLDTAGFERVRRNTQRALDSTLQNAGHRARQQWRAMVFPDHPFGRPYSYTATLAALQLGHARNDYDDNFGAARAHIYVSGVFDDNLIEHAVRDAFSDWKAGSAAAPRPTAAVARRQFMLVDSPGAAKSTIWLGLPVIDPSSSDFVKLEVANGLLSGAFGSSATMNFGDDQGLTGSTGSNIWMRKGASYWAGVAQVNGDSTGFALESMLNQIEHLRREVPADSEVERVKQDVIGRFNALRLSRQGIVSQLAYVDEFGLGEIWLAEYVKRVMAVSAEDIRQMAASQLDPERMTITVVGDRATVEPQVGRFRPQAP